MRLDINIFTLLAKDFWAVERRWKLGIKMVVGLGTHFWDLWIGEVGITFLWPCE